MKEFDTICGISTPIGEGGISIIRISGDKCLDIIDRIFRGFVVDFISLKWVGIFNFADSYIVLGVLFIIFMEIREIFKDGEADKKSDFTSWWI